MFSLYSVYLHIYYKNKTLPSSPYSESINMHNTRHQTHKNIENIENSVLKFLSVKFLHINIFIYIFLTCTKQIYFFFLHTIKHDVTFLAYNFPSSTIYPQYHIQNFFIYSKKKPIQYFATTFIMR